MTRAADKRAFAARMREVIDRFRQWETVFREEYQRAPGEAPPKSLTERMTRRHLVDPFLAALDWRPDDPRAVVEEARARVETVLFLDYLGVDYRSRAPALIVEAKTFDELPPRAQRSPTPSSREMPEHIANTINAIRQGARDKSPLLAQWTSYLSSLRDYVQSVEKAGRESLQRVVMTSGKKRVNSSGMPFWRASTAGCGTNS